MRAFWRWGLGGRGIKRTGDGVTVAAKGGGEGGASGLACGGEREGVCGGGDRWRVVCGEGGAGGGWGWRGRGGGGRADGAGGWVGGGLYGECRAGRMGRAGVRCGEGGVEGGSRGGRRVRGGVGGRGKWGGGGRGVVRAEGEAERGGCGEMSGGRVRWMWGVVCGELAGGLDGREGSVDGGG